MKVKTFIHPNISELETAINDFLEYHGEHITVIDIKFGIAVYDVDGAISVGKKQTNSANIIYTTKTS
jgi:hypothetical protein